MGQDPVNIFVSYSHKNSNWLDEDKDNLIPYLEAKLKHFQCNFWYDYNLRTNPGIDYEQNIIDEINSSDIAVLLLSPDFFESDFISTTELPEIKKQYDNGKLKIIPILIEKCEFPEGNWIEKLQIIPDPQTPLTKPSESKDKFHSERHEILQGFHKTVNLFIIERIRKKTIVHFAKRNPWSLMLLLIPVFVIIYFVSEKNAFQSLNQEVLTINYSFHVNKSGEYKEIFNGDTVYSGDKLRINIKSSEECYLLVLNIDATDKIDPLFPLNGIAISDTRYKEITIPGESSFFVADNQKGLEKIIIMASRNPIEFMQDFIEKYNQSTTHEKNQLNIADEINLRGFSKVVTEDSSDAPKILTNYKDFNLLRNFSGKDNLMKEINLYHF